MSAWVVVPPHLPPEKDILTFSISSEVYIYFIIYHYLRIYTYLCFIIYANLRVLRHFVGCRLPGQFTHRVAATTCCSQTGLACLNPMNLRIVT